MHIEKKTLRNIFIGTICCIVLYWILHSPDRAKAIWGTISSVLTPFAAGAALAFVLNVPMRGFEKLLKGIKKKVLRRIISVTLTLICVCVLLGLVFWMLIPQLLEAVRNLIPSIGNFFIGAEEFFMNLFNDNKELLNWLAQKANLESFNWSSVVQWAMGIVSSGLQSLVNGLFETVGGVLSGLFDAFIAVFFAIYCLFQKETLARQARKVLYAFLPEKAADKTIEIAILSNETFANFLSGQCIEVCILGALFALAMTIFGMPYAPLVSVLIAVTAFIPIVGAWIGCVVGAFLMFVNDPGSLQPVWFVVMSVVLQQLENNLIYPHVVGSSIGLSGFWVLLAVGVGGELFGVGGMFIMIPVTSIIYAIVRDITNKRLSNLDIDPAKLSPNPSGVRSKLANKVKNMGKKKASKTPVEDNEN